MGIVPSIRPFKKRIATVNQKFVEKPIAIIKTTFTRSYTRCDTNTKDADNHCCFSTNCISYATPNNSAWDTAQKEGGGKNSC